MLNLSLPLQVIVEHSPQEPLALVVVVVLLLVDSLEVEVEVDVDVEVDVEVEVEVDFVDPGALSQQSLISALCTKPRKVMNQSV